MSRPLTAAEYELTRWLLEHGKPEATNFLPQLERAQGSDWKCTCGCASFNFEIDGHEAPPGVNVLSDFVFGEGENLCGIFAYESKGVLAGVEVCGYAVDAPKALPTPAELRSIENWDTKKNPLH